MVLFSLNISIEKINQVISVVLNKLAKTNVERPPLVVIKAMLMQETLVT